MLKREDVDVRLTAIFAGIAVAGVIAGYAGGAVASTLIASFTTPLMGLEIPDIGESGPDYAQLINDAFEEVDAHDHTTGKGTQVPTAGVLINADLEFNQNDATEVRTIRLDPAAVSIAASDRRALYHVGGELFYIDDLGNAVQITINGALNATPGSISGMTGSASVVYSSITNTFAFTDDSGAPGGGDFGCIRIAEEVSGGKGPVLCSNAATAADYAFTFPAALPVANRLLCLDAAGDVTTCTASALTQALVVATSTSSATMSTTGDGAIGDDLIVYDDLEVRGGATGTASTTGGSSKAADGTSNSTVTPVNVGGASFTGLGGAGNDQFYIKCDLTVSSAATSTGVQIGLDFNGTMTGDFKCWTWEDVAGTPTFVERGFTTDDAACAAAGSGAGSDAPYVLSGWFEVSTATSVTLRLRSEVAASNTTVHAGLCTLVPVNL